MPSVQLGVLAVGAILAGSICTAFGQTPGEVDQVGNRRFGVSGPGHRPPMTGLAAEGAAMRAGKRMVHFVAADPGLGLTPVTNAPYSADANTEFLQTLADGTRISRKNTSSIYRDSQGRVRREQTFQMVGPWATTGEAPKRITITDPVAKEIYVLDPASKTARRMKMPDPAAGPRFFDTEIDERGSRPMPPTGRVSVSVAAATDPLPEAGSNRIFKRRVTIAPHMNPGAAGVAQHDVLFRRGSDAKEESLGQQVIEGVPAEGTRTTNTIPVGEIGNDRPITMVMERWYSSELQTEVMTKHTDPLMGENSFRLTNIRRAEPAATLFQVPPDYTVTDMKSPFSEVEAVPDNAQAPK